MLASATSAVVMVSGSLSTAQAHYVDTGTSSIRYIGTRPQNVYSPSVAKTNVGWLDKQVRKVAVLETNWDGYGADRVDVTRLNQITKILANYLPEGAPAGSIFPGADGSIQAEWHTISSSFGLLVDDKGSVSAWLRLPNLDEVEETGIAATELLRFASLRAML